MTPHAIAFAVEIATTLLAVAGLGYFAAATLAARKFLAARRQPLTPFAPGVSILKSLKGLDPGMMEAFRTHCRQEYAGECELLFGVSSMDDPAAAAVIDLQREFPTHAIQLIECPEQLGSNRKVSNLIQLARHARHPFLLVNDSDITVSPHYLERVMAHFARPETGLVTALYRGRAHGSLPSRFEAIGIATDFQPGVLLSKWIDGCIRFGLGSTLAVRRAALEKIGGFAAIVDCLADDYELGARVAKAGYEVILCGEPVETSVPAYDWRGYFDHQIRWARTVRDARPGGYVGLIFTHGLVWALVNLVASGASLFSLCLLAVSLLLRFTMALTVGLGVLGDREIAPHLWLLPLRDVVFFGVWLMGFAGNTIVWRGERFHLKKGKLYPA
jgi:ceramide glucosyltransferase